MLTFGMISTRSTTSVENNLETLKVYAMQAKTAGCTALCFPECFLTGYDRTVAKTRSIETSSSYLEEVKSLAKELSLDLLVGFMERDEDHFYITHGIFLAGGESAYYRKTHLGERELQAFTAGDSLDVFTLSCGAKIGFQLCVETHFNDITQTLSLKGANLIFAPFAVPRVAGDREALWKKYIPARSYDNQVYFACCNQWDEERFGGGIFVTDPKGTVLASSFEDAPTLLTFEIPENLLLQSEESSKKKHYFPAKRRPELYQ